MARMWASKEIGPAKVNLLLCQGFCSHHQVVDGPEAGPATQQRAAQNGHRRPLAMTIQMMMQRARTEVVIWTDS